MEPDDNPYRVPPRPVRPTFEVTVDEVDTPRVRPNWRVFATVCLCIVGMFYGAGAFRMLFFGGNHDALGTLSWPERIIITPIFILISLLSFVCARGWYEGWLRSWFFYSLLALLPLWLAAFDTLYNK